jgi:hypothetical protein
VFGASLARLSTLGPTLTRVRIFVLGQTMRIPLSERLNAKLDKSGDCWTWQGATNHGGYGCIGRGGQGGETLLAHRAMWELVHGPVPASLHVLHSCDNPPCCNPDHLHLGTPADNARERTARGRNPLNRGEDGSAAKLTESKVLHIRTKYATTNTSYAKLARQFHVSKACIGRIVRRETWQKLSSAHRL